MRHFFIRHQYSYKPSTVWIEKKYFSCKNKIVFFVSYFRNWRTHTLYFCIILIFSYCCSYSLIIGPILSYCCSEKVWELGLYHRGWKNIFMDQWFGKYYCILWRIQAKWGFGWQVWFVLYCKYSGSGGEQGSHSKILLFIPSFNFGRTIFPVFKLTQTCDLQYSINFFSGKLAA